MSNSQCAPENQSQDYKVGPDVGITQLWPIEISTKPDMEYVLRVRDVKNVIRTGLFFLTWLHAGVFITIIMGAILGLLDIAPGRDICIWLSVIILVGKSIAYATIWVKLRADISEEGLEPLSLSRSNSAKYSARSAV